MTYINSAQLSRVKNQYRASLSLYQAPRMTRGLGLYLPTRPVVVQGSPTSVREVRVLAGLGLNTQTQGAAAGAATGAKIGSAIMPGIGTAIGAVVGAVYGWTGGQQPSHAEQTWDSYKAYAGSGQLVVLPDTDEAEVWKGAYDTNNKFFNISGVKNRAGYVQWLVNLLQQGMSNGTITPANTARQIVDTVVYPAMKAAGSKLNDSDIMHGFLADMVNRLFAGLPIHNERTNNRPLQPISLSVPANFAQTSTAQNAPPANAPPNSAVVPPTTLPGAPGQPPVVVPPAPPVTASQAPNIPPAAAGSASDLIQSMLAQNSSQADAYEAALKKLAASGVTVTPQVQQAVAGEVQAQSTNYIPWIIGGAALLLVFASMGRKRSKR